MTLYRLDGEYYDKNGQNAEPPENGFHGWPVLETKIADQNTATEPIDSFANPEIFGESNDPGCFLPGLGIEVNDGASKTDVVICLFCDHAVFYNQENGTRASGISKSGKRWLADVYDKVFPGHLDRAILFPGDSQPTAEAVKEKESGK